jgi:hypothetical protein
MKKPQTRRRRRRLMSSPNKRPSKKRERSAKNTKPLNLLYKRNAMRMLKETVWKKKRLIRSAKTLRTPRRHA